MSKQKNARLSTTINDAVHKQDLASFREVVSHSDHQVKRWKALLDQAGDAILTIEPETGLFLDYSRRALEMFGVDESRFGSLAIDDLVPATDHPWVWRALRSAMMTDQNVTIEEVPVRTQDGRPLYCDVTTTTIQLDDSVVIQGIFRDVTERVKMLHASRRHQEELEAKNIALEDAQSITADFLATISHELKTPLHTIIGFNSLMEDEMYGPINDRQRRVIRKVDANASHLQNLLERLLQASRLEAGVVGVVKEDFDAVRGVTRILEPYRSTFEEKGLTLTFDSDHSELWVRSDESMFREIVRQLVSNALEFTETGSVTVGLRSEGANAVLRVADTGPGIPEKDRRTIFELFRRSSSSPAERHPGAGLGLSLVSRLCDLLGEEVTVASTVGKGTEFTIVSPRVVLRAVGKEEADASEAVAPIEASAELPEQAKGPLDVLVVDASPYTVEVLATTLEKEAGCRVRRAYCGMEAMLKLTEKRPDIILIDVSPAGVNGERILQYGYEYWGEDGFRTVALLAEDLPPEQQQALQEQNELTLLKQELTPQTILETLSPILDKVPVL